MTLENFERMQGLVEIEVMKQLEEAAENESEYLADYEDKEAYQKAFIAGAKWQQERMYSEEEVMNIIDSFIDNLQDYTPTFNSRQEWFKQFKKK
jgi:hypothetical protein